MLAAYFYAVNRYSIRSITHKYLQRGHTQNEGDTIHSNIGKVVKKAKRCGCIYVPDQYATLIRQSNKKLEPINLHELNFDDFYNLKALYDDVGFRLNENEAGNSFKVKEVRVLKFEKGSDVFYYKNSYKETEWHSLCFLPKTLRTRKQYHSLADYELKNAFTKTLALPENKKKDLKMLCNDCTIPPYYHSFYESIFK